MQDNQSSVAELQQQIKTLQEKVETLEEGRKDQLSVAVISGDMDKVMATLIVSLAAAAMDTQVKLFFSFWAIGALRDPKKAGKEKNFISKMFGMMLPKGTGKLRLSKFNMLGMGPAMMKGLMKSQGVLSIEEMFKQAGELGIEIVVCEMTMNLMGFKKEEMIDYPNLTYAGAATFMADSSESAMQWMI